MSTPLANGASPERKAALEQYEAGMKLFAQQKFDKAKAFLEKVRQSAIPDLAERAQLHLAICNQRVEGAAPHLRSGDDHYNFAVVQMNQANYELAEEHLQRAVKLDGKSAHVEYALAALHALRNEIDVALEHLHAAIAMDRRYRLFARNDDDFKLLMDDPRFTEELYPEQS
ncbi:MAG: TPR end-of-group domain-containing protein [Terriglobales bacterium]